MDKELSEMFGKINIKNLLGQKKQPHRFINQDGFELIKKFEGFSAEPYICSGGCLTIGYGHKILPSDRFNKISKNRALILLKRDLLKFERSVLKYIEVPLTNNQFSALVSFTFNVGIAALQRSVLRQKINYEQYDEAAKEFEKWVWADGKKINGLTRRRKAEKNLFLLLEN